MWEELVSNGLTSYLSLDLMSEYWAWSYGEGTAGDEMCGMRDKVKK